MVLDVTNTMATITKKIILFVRKLNRYHILGIIFLVLIISSILRLLTPQLPPKETLIQKDSPLTQKATLSFSSDIHLDLPSKLNTYVTESRQQSVEQFATNFANKNNYSEITSNKKTWVNSTNSSSITIEEINNNVLFKNFYSPDQINLVKKTASIEEAKNIFVKFINESVGLQAFTITKQTPVFISNEAIEDSADNESNAYQFEVSQLIDSIPLIVGTRRSPLAKGIVMKDGNIFEVVFYPYTTTFNKVREYSPLSLETMKKNAESGLITYLVSSSNTEDNYEANLLATIDFSIATLEYRQNEENGYILPYVHFTGVGKDHNGITYNVEAITPAIRVE